MPDDKFTPGPEFKAGAREGVATLEQPTVTLNVQFITPENIPLIFVDHGVATWNGSEVVVSMYQTRPPVGPVKSGDTIQTHCMVRLVMATEKALQLYHAIGGALGLSPADLSVTVETGQVVAKPKEGGKV